MINTIGLLRYALIAKLDKYGLIDSVKLVSYAERIVEPCVSFRDGEVGSAPGGCLEVAVS